MNQALYLVPLITYTFGALTFSVLALLYWRERRGGRIFTAFTMACLAAFVINLLLGIVRARAAGAIWENVLISALDMASGLLPPILLHVLYADEQADLPVRRLWLTLLASFYVIGIGSAAARAVDDSELLETAWSGQLDSVPVLMLGVAAALGILLQVLSQRALKAVERRQRRWNIALLCAMFLCAVGSLMPQAPWFNLLPDYLVLGFFCVTLYFKERLVFFDLLIKRGVFFALALVALTLFFLLFRPPQGWSAPWLTALLLLPFWLAGPWIYNRLSRAIDRVWLRRRYSPADAERQFVRDVQASTTEEDLHHRVTESLTEIFQAPAVVLFTPVPAPPRNREDGLVAELEQDGVSLGWIILEDRTNSIPYMSDDRRLVQSLARTLGVVLENVRFREQQKQREEREQQLRLLTSRAELKALRAQINPHFLFNALNAIAGLIRSQPELADETVEQLAEVFRYTLRNSNSEWVRLDEEIDFVSAYLRVEQARFGKRLKVELDVEPAAGAVLVPAMTIQPLIENAIKHGVSVSERGGTVGLQVRLEAGVLRVEVFDDGPGFPADFANEPAIARSDRGHGLRNVAERLAGYYGSDAKLTWENGCHRTRVSLSIPRGVS